jgi:hypothetical protein
MEDYGDINNALSDGPSVEATASYRIDWLGGHHHVRLHNAAGRFTGTFVEGAATAEWSAENADGFRFRSDPRGTSSTVFAVLGKERNGVFFS